ncbi:hypothetical protein M2283_004750 [Streptomyces pseudovenezuelae]|uniref:ResB-like domain-containing protein n=1 Tax=Streptomyces pseudovenezuelae TaxID=67350 RepID=A0ABT6LMD7_9ACTN|nr:hypothetical protein [Streptomyces pseudovenezuelae]
MFFAVFLVFTVVAAFGSGPDDPYASGSSDPASLSDVLVPSADGISGLTEPWHAWVTLGVFALIALCLHAQRTQFSRVLAAELSPQRFPDAASDPAEQAEGHRFQELKQRIRLEQHAPLVMYH